MGSVVHSCDMGGYLTATGHDVCWNLDAPVYDIVWTTVGVGTLVTASLYLSLIFAIVPVTGHSGMSGVATAMVLYNLLDDNGHKAHSGDGS